MQFARVKINGPLAHLLGIVLLLSLTIDHGTAQAISGDRRALREICITFDDLPAADGNIKQMTNSNRRLLKVISDYKIPAIGFVNESKLYVKDEVDNRIALLQMWNDAGLELGNHTFSHISIDRNSLAAYEEDIIRGETVTSGLLAAKGKKLRYFRHTQLRTGPTNQYREDLNRFLAARGYTIAPVTIDNQEWVFANAYAGAIQRGDRASMKKIGEAYVNYMETTFAFFEQLSRDFLNYEVPQILLLHVNALNADYFGDLVRMMDRRGYKYISLDDALKDKAYRLPESQSSRGLSWLHRWMLAKGLPLREEPREPEWIAKLNAKYSVRQ